MNQLAVAAGYEIKIDFNWAKNDPMQSNWSRSHRMLSSPPVMPRWRL